MLHAHYHWKLTSLQNACRHGCRTLTGTFNIAYIIFRKPAFTRDAGADTGARLPCLTALNLQKRRDTFSIR